MSKAVHFLFQWRKYRGLTQEVLASKIGIDRSYYSKIETGESDYNQNILQNIADALGCKTSDLLNRDPKASPTIYSVLEDISPFDHEEAVKALTAIKARRTPSNDS